jgi:uncharacterized delta-60 repeat protein
MRRDNSGTRGFHRQVTKKLTAKTLTLTLLLALVMTATIFTIIAVNQTPTPTTPSKPQQNSDKQNDVNRESSPPAASMNCWAKTYGGKGDDQAESIVQTSDGGYIVAGKTYSFGASGFYFWILKLDPAGSVAWQKMCGGGSDEEAYSVQQTSDGGYIVAGSGNSFNISNGGDVWVLKLDSAGGVTWQKTYGGTGSDIAYSIRQTSDGGYIAAGTSWLSGPATNDAMVLKLNSTGGLTWMKTYGGTAHDYAYSVQQTSDGGYVVAGYTFVGINNYQAWVLKLNSAGGVTWQKTYNGTGDNRAQSIQQTSDGGYILAGFTSSFGVSGSDIWVLKLNSTGDVTWQKTYGGNGYEDAYSVQQTSDGGYIVAGYTTSFGAVGYDFWVLKLNSTGGVTWQKAYGGSGDDYVNSIQQTSDGGYIAAGSTWSFGAGIRDFWLVKLGVDGSIVWYSGSGVSTTTTNCNPVDSSAIEPTVSWTPVDRTGIVMSTTVTPRNTYATVTVQSAGTYWAETYGGTDEDGGVSVQQTSDGGYMVEGSTLSFGAGSGDVWVMKLDSAGSVTWQKTYGGTGDDEVSSMLQTADGGYILTGETNSFNASSSYDCWVLKLDPVGSVVWQKTYGGSGVDWAYSVQQTSDGGYVVAGSTGSFGAIGLDVWVLKLDSAGGVTWQKTYGGDGNDRAYSVQQTSDGGYIVAGDTLSFGAIGYDFWVLKLFANGSVTWQRDYGSGIYDLAYSVQQTSDGGYILAGATNRSSAVDWDFWVLKLFADGTVNWSKTYGGNGYDWARSIQQTSDGGYIVSGYTDSFGAGYGDFWVLKLNSIGDVTWQKAYGGSGYDEAYSVQQTSDGGYIATGYTGSFGAGGDFWVVKLANGGDIVWRSGSGASTTPTSGSTADFVPSSWDTSAIPSNSTATIASTGVTPRDTRARVTVQASCDASPPVAITDLTTSDSTATSITLTWTAPGDDEYSGTATGYWVKYSTSGQITALNWGSATNFTQSWTPLPAGSKEIHVIPILKNDTKYWFAVEAYDEVCNYGGISNSPSGKTLDAFAPATITDLATSNPTTGNITLTWTAPGDNGTLGTVAGYIVKYSTSGVIDASNWDSATTFTSSFTAKAAGSTETHVVTGLETDTMYWFAVEAYDEASNYGGISNSPSRSTSDIVAPAAITNLAVTTVENFSVTLTWTAPGDNGHNGTATGYWVKYSTAGPINASNWASATNYTQTWVPARNGTTETHEVTGLTPGIKYWFAVEAYDDASNYGGVSNSINATTTAIAQVSGVGTLIIVVGGVAGVAVIVIIVAVIYVKRKR